MLKRESRVKCKALSSARGFFVFADSPALAFGGFNALYRSKRAQFFRSLLSFLARLTTFAVFFPRRLWSVWLVLETFAVYFSSVWSALA